MDEATFHWEMQELIRQRMADPLCETGRILRQMQQQVQKPQESEAKRKAREDNFLATCRAAIEIETKRAERILRGGTSSRSSAQKSTLAKKNAAASVAARRKKNQGWISRVLQQGDMKRIRQFREDTPEVLRPWQQAGGRARARTRTYRAGEGGCFPRKPGSRKPVVAVLN
jgi:hypothetical protein